MTRRAVIIGSGVFGTTAALELTRRGWRVILLEQGRAPHPKATSSDFNRIVRADYGADAFHTDLALEAIARWEAWNGEWPDPPFHRDGYLLLSRGGLEPGTYEGDSMRMLSERGVELETFTPAGLARRFPAWRGSDYAAAMLDRRAGWVEAARALATLVAQALYLAPEDPAPFTAPRFCPWADDIANSGWYGIGALPDGRVKVGHHGEGIAVDPGGPCEVPEAFLPSVRAFLAGPLPGLAPAPVASSRLCVYCDTRDGDFWIDHDPDRPGLLVASGGSGHGFKFAPVLGEIIADVAERRDNPWAGRYAWPSAAMRSSWPRRYASRSRCASGPAPRGRVT